MDKYSSEEDIHSWLSLVTQHGLFVSDPVLNTAFSKGVECVSPESFRAFKREFDLYSIYSEKDDVAKFTKWINFILEDFLGFSRSSWCKHPNIQDDVKHYLFEYDQWLAPDRVLLSNDGKPLLLVKIVKNGKSLERPEKEKGKWKASPYFKLTTLCLEKNIPLALLTNGDEFRLIHVKPTTGTSYFEWTARDCYEEKSLLDSFYTFLNKDRFFGDEQKRLLHLIDESQKRQLDVTDQLGAQMHHALEIFVRAIGNLKQSDLQDLFSNATGEYIYEMSLTFMMRLVFLLYAEENGLLPHGNFVYENNYGISHLVYQIQSRSNNEDYMNKKDAWPRILALFRLIYNGCGHPDVKSIPYDSKLFDPERFPELEHPSLVLDNNTIWKFLHNLCYAETKIGREKVKQKVSYHTIDVEQIGSVYESLIGFSVERAPEKMVVFRSGENTIRPISEFISLDDDALADYLKSVTDKTEDSIRNILDKNEESVEGLGRFERFIAEEGIIEKGQLYISRAGSIRKSSGTYYTPKEITRFLVQEALEPLVYEETDDGKRIKNPREILDLNVCDPAMGSGAFLVQAIRYLSERLIESWTKINSATDENITLPYGNISHGADNEELLPSYEKEALQRAKLYIAQNCIYGVDKNPMAVELAKVSIWLTTMCKDRPLTFLDHRLKCGDSIIGSDFDCISKIPDAPLWKEDKKYNREATKTKTLFGINFEENIKDILSLRENLKSPELTIDDIKRKATQYKEAHTDRKPISKLKKIFSLWTSVWFWPYNEKDNNISEIGKKKTVKTTLFSVDDENNWNSQKNFPDDLHHNINTNSDTAEVISPPHTNKYREVIEYLVTGKSSTLDIQKCEQILEISNKVTDEQRFFHWQLEFPEIFQNLDGAPKDNSGFSAIVGNPPWDVYKPLEKEFFSKYDIELTSLELLSKTQTKKRINQLLQNSEIKKDWYEYCRKFELLSIFFKNIQTYQNIGGGEVNAYKAFLLKEKALICKNGTLSVVVPSGLHVDSVTQPLRKEILFEPLVKCLIKFDNEKKIFPAVAHGFRFDLVSIVKKSSNGEIPALFTSWEDASIVNKFKSFNIQMDIKVLKKLSPETHSIMEFSNNKEYSLVQKMYTSGNTLGNKDCKWNIKISNELHPSKDNHLLQENEAPWRVLGGRSFYQYNSDYAPPRGYITSNNVQEKFNKKRYVEVCEQYKIVLRSISNGSGARTLISTISPSSCLYTAALVVYFGEKRYSDRLFLVSALNSFFMDFLLRKKVQMNVSKHIINQLPIIKLDYRNWFYRQIICRTARLICINNLSFALE